MKKDKVKVFKDSIHGYIEIPSVIVSNIIDTEQFQRLRYIEQTSMRSLYPAARHDRFIHSLGVYYLGKLAFDGFEENSKKVINALKKKVDEKFFNSEEINQSWWDKQKLLFEIACLMHDCAHAPFSHTLEAYYHLKLDRNLKPVLSSLLAEECEKLGDKSFKEDFFKGKDESTGAPHEQLSSFVILSEYKEAIRMIFKKLLPKTKIEENDIAFICRMIIGCKYKEKSVQDSLKNCIISLLNSSTIDVDGLDYIVRDAHMSGISAYNVDYQRILNSFTIIPVINYPKKLFKEKENISGLWLAGSVFEVASFEGKIKGQFTIIVDSQKLKNKVFVCKGNFFGEDKVPHSEDYNTELTIDNITEGKLRLVSASKMDGVVFSGSISGRKMITPEDEIKGDVSFVLGYDKRCLSILQNTIDARNNEYLWIYTHPKVLYNSHFLQCALLDAAAEYLSNKLNLKNFEETGNKENIYGKEDCIVQILGYSQLFKDKKDEQTCVKLKELNYYFYRSNDDDINALFKSIYLKINDEKDESEISVKFQYLYEDYYRRHQRKTFWKSFMEKEVFSDYCKANESDFEGINQLLEETTALLEENKIKHYNDITDEKGKIFSEFGFENVVVICSTAKTKVIEFPDFFVKYGDRVERLCDIFDSNMLGKGIKKPVNYIFYDGKEIKDYNIILELNERLKELYNEKRISSLSSE